MIAKTRAKSQIWKYFGLPADENGLRLDNDITICKTCMKPIRGAGGTTSNMINHLRVHHPLQYSEMAKRSDKVLPLPHSSRNEVEDPNSSSSLEEIEVKCDLEPLSDLQDHEKQITLLDDQSSVSEPSDSTTELVTTFLACTMQPDDLVERKPFMNMIRYLNPSYHLPDARYFTTTGIPNLYNDTLEKLQMEISLVKDENLTITMDSWISMDNIPFVAVTVHFIDDQWNLKSVYLSCADFEIKHTYSNICDALTSILSDWGLSVASITSCTTDNRSNVLKAISHLQLQHIPCFGHTINLGISQALEIPPLDGAVLKIKKLHSAISLRSEMKRDLAKAREFLQQDAADLPGACPNTWKSVLKLVQRFLCNKEPIRKMLQGYPGEEHLFPGDADISVLEDFVSCTKLLDDITTTLSGEEYLSASSVLPLYGKIRKNLQLKDSDSALAKQIKSVISTSLSEPYKEESLNTVLWMSSLCDPRFRLNFADNPDHIKTFAVQQMTSHYANIDSSDERDSEIKEGLEKLFDSEDSDSDTMPERKAESELNRYLGMPKVNWNINPISWWKLHEDSFPGLKTVARKYLAMQGSSVPPERVFSMRGDVVLRQRAALLQENTKMQIFLTQNYNNI